MQNCLFNALIICFLIALIGCQSNQAATHVFHSSSSAESSSMNLEQLVEDALKRNEDPDIAQVQVGTVRDVVILSGYVKKIRQSDTAEQIARQVPGVQAVENNIIIRH